MLIKCLWTYIEYLPAFLKNMNILKTWFKKANFEQEKDVQ